MQSRATLIFWKDPKMWIFESATTIRVLEVFSITFLVLPSFPTTRPIARDKLSPWRILTSLISNVSMYRSSNRSRASASSGWNPRVNALMKSTAFWMAPISVVSSQVYRIIRFALGVGTWVKHTRSSIALDFKFILTCKPSCSTRGV